MLSRAIEPVPGTGVQGNPGVSTGQSTGVSLLMDMSGTQRRSFTDSEEAGKSAHNVSRDSAPPLAGHMFRNLLPAAARQSGRLVWLGNLEAERFWARPGVIRLPSVSRPTDAAIVNRLEEMALFLAQDSDLVILRRPSDSQFLDYLAALGLSLPSILTTNAGEDVTPISQVAAQDAQLCGTLRDMAGREDLYLLPFATTRLEEQFAVAAGVGRLGPEAAVCERVNSKIYSRRISSELGLRTIPGAECESLASLSTSYRELRSEHNGPFVIKESMGVSGRGLSVFDSPSRLENLITLLQRRETADSQVEFVLEQWVDKISDINYQIFVDPSGQVVPLGLKEAVTQKGVHRGHRWPASLLPAQLACYLEAGQAVGRRLYADGFVGVAGIDSVIDREGTVYPVLEINARFNMSTYELRLNEIVGPDAVVEVKYYSISLREPLEFRQLASALRSDLICAGKSHGIGIFCYATANCNFRHGSTLPVRGRVYSFLAGENEAEIARLDIRMLQALEACGVVIAE